MNRLNRTFDGIIFDVDGTLWDATGVAADAYNKVFERDGLSLRVTADRLKHLFGKPMDVIFSGLLPDVPAAKRLSLSAACMEQENADLTLTPGRCYPDILPVFRSLSGRYPLFIVSNCQCGYIELLMETAGIAPYVRGHLCFGDTGVPKGQTLRILAERCCLHAPVYVGDIQGDADACAEAGIPIIHAAYGYGTIREPLARVRSLKELEELLLLK